MRLLSEDKKKPVCTFGVYTGIVDMSRVNIGDVGKFGFQSEER